MNNLVDIELLNNPVYTEIEVNNVNCLIESDNIIPNLIVESVYDKIILESIEPSLALLEISEPGLQGPPGDTVLDDLVVGEVPIGVTDGFNTVFNSHFNFVPETVEVYLNGIRQKIIEDYQLLGFNTIQFIFSPSTGETVILDYLKQ